MRCWLRKRSITELWLYSGKVIHHLKWLRSSCCALDARDFSRGRLHEVEKLLVVCPSWEHVRSQYLPDQKTMLGDVSIVLPYTHLRESGAPTRNAIIPIAEGCSMLPLLDTTLGLIPMPEEYTRCACDEIVELLEKYEKEAARISYLLRTCLSRIDEGRLDGTVS